MDALIRLIIINMGLKGDIYLVFIINIFLKIVSSTPAFFEQSLQFFK